MLSISVYLFTDAHVTLIFKIAFSLKRSND